MNTNDLLPWAEDQLTCCELCPRCCRVNRLAGERGVCGVGSDIHVFREFIHYGEEAGISPSQTVYLTGCNLSCVFCQTADDHRCEGAEQLTHESLAALIKSGLERGAGNLNFLGGDPVVNLPGLITLLYKRKTGLPVIWNSNMYMTRDACDAAMQISSLFLADLKFGNNKCAKRLCGAGDYWPVVTERLLQAYETGHDMIIRHLIIPGHLTCCTQPILEWIRAFIPKVPLSLKWEYLPMRNAKGIDDLGRYPVKDDYHQSLRWAEELGLNLVSTSTGTITHLETSTGDWEIIISPSGDLYFPHPNASATSICQSIQTQQKEIC